MNKQEVYVYYSPATDITGKNFVDKLEVSGGKVKPPASKKLVIGWGAKTDDDITFPKGVQVLNHPNAIRANRNKFGALTTMAKALNVAGATHIPLAVAADKVKAELVANRISFPLIGRKKYHQGGKGFWNCPTVAQLEDAIASGADYFQVMVPIKDEFRLHVFGDKVIHAVKKVKRTEEEFENAFVEDELARQKSLAEKNKDPFDEATARMMLKRQAKNAAAGGANMLIRSNRMGWKFSIIKKCDVEMAKIAIAAVKALGLDFGAVDCCTDTNGNMFIFEVNSGPGLEATSFDKYVEAFEEVIAKFGKVEVAPPVVADAKITKPVKGTVEVETPIVGERAFMQLQLSRLQEMLKEADDADLATIKTLGAKLIFGKNS